jgi:prepilin peptidase CpaA
MHIDFFIGLCVAFIAVMLWAAWYDLRNRVIQHGLIFTIALSAPLTWWAMGLPLMPTLAWGQPWLLMLMSAFSPPNVAAIIIVAALLFFLFAFFFAIGWMGGGDVKLLGAMGLWLLPREIVILLIVEAIAGAVVTLLAAAHHRWKKKEGRTEVPRGVSIAFAGIWVMVERYLNHFS